MARLVAGRFECERLAGSGGMGHVWRARDRLTGEPVALKLLRGEGDELAGRFLREARMLGRLEHPAVVRYVAHGEDQGELYLAMEWLEGEDLAHRLERGKLDADEALLLVRRLAQALQAAHALGVIHRDLKPANVFLPGQDLAAAKLLDFGVARLLGASLATRAGAIIGTPAYMSPEQARGDGDLDARSDLFALGCVWLECLSGRAAFHGAHVVMVLAKVLFDEPADLAAAELPAHLRALLARLLAKSRGERPASAGALLAELDATPRPPPPSSGEIAQLGRGELRRFFVVVAAPPEVVPLGETSTPEQNDAADESVRRVAADTEVRLERLVDGSWVGAASVALGAVDAAARVARTALSLARALPSVRVAAATGRGVAHGRVPAGEIIDRAALLARGRDGEHGVLLDDGMAGLLDARFELVRRGTSFLLVGERPSDDGLRTLLGRATPCLGRERELGMLRGTLAACESDGVARAVLVTAPPGTGKSRLRRELVAQLQAQGRPMALWSARADAMSAGSPLGLLAQLVRSAAGIEGSETGEQARAKLDARVRRRLPAGEVARVSTFLAELASLAGHDDVPAALAAARRDPPLLAEQVQRAWEDLVAAECATGLVLVVVEDLHWGDWPSVRLLGAALRRAAESSFVILALARPEVHERFPGLWREHGLEEIHLPQLPRRAAERLVRHSLPEVASADVERLVGLAAGNCFYLEELIRALASGRRELPESVLAMAQGRYELLDDATRRLLRAAAILGESFWLGGVATLLGDDAETLRERLAVMAEQELIERRGRSRFPGQSEYAFRHALLREAAYAALPEDERRLGHGLACIWLEAAGELEAWVLAEHAALAEAHPAAARHFARAAEQALEAGDFDGALARVSRGREHAPEPAVCLTLDLAELEASKWKGAREALVRVAGRVLAQATPGSPAWCRVFADAAPQFFHLHDREKVLAEVEPEPAARADFVVCLARVLTQSCIALRHREVEPLFARLEAMGGEDPSLAGWLHQARGFRATALRDLSAALDELAASAAAFSALGDEKNALAQLADAGEILRELGFYARSAEQLGQVAARCQQLRLDRLAGFCRFNKAWAESYLCEGEALRAALARMQASVPVFSVWRVWCQYSLASGYLRLGDLAAAEACLEVAQVPPDGDAGMISILPLQADLALRRGRVAESLALIEQVRSRPSVLNDALFWGHAQAVRVEVLRALGRDAEARDFLAGALRELADIAAAISEPAVRAGLEDRVFEYRRLRELGDELGLAG